MMSVRILGPVEASVEGRPSVVRGQLQLKLFAFLVLRANRAVSSDALVDAVWGSGRSGADNRLQMAIARLRKALAQLGDGGESPLRTVAGGYLLSIGPGELDADVFSAAVQDGRRALDGGDPARAAELLRSALSLWRGPPLAELAFEDFAQADIRRLEELRLVALEGRIDADMQLGAEAQLVGELEALLAEDPSREHLASQLMLALYRCGRQADALAVFQRVRAHLADELGLEPGPALKAIQTQILNQDPCLDRGTPPAAVTAARTAHDGSADESRPTVPPSVRSNLPAPPNPLVGRHDEMSRALVLLADHDVRLLTLWGPPGAGKTRLALETATVAAGRYRDGVWLVPLAPVPDAALMVAEVSRVLDVAPVAGETPEAALVRALSGRELLLVLDNFEHLLDASGVVADLLASAPRVDVLSTSREPLRLRGEHRMEVPPLPPPDAAELFLARARAIRPDLSIDRENRAAIDRICERLDGLPLALEFAAARVALFEPRQLEKRLAERLTLPEGPRDLPERQRTLRGTIGWSYQLLDPAERNVLERLSPFIGGVRIDSAEAIWGADAVEGLISLAEKSLLRRREDPDGELRLWMLETVREFALDRAAAEGLAEEAAGRHAEYFVALAEQAAPNLHGSEQRQWLDRLESEHANLRAALDHLTVREPSKALRMGASLMWFWEIRGYRIEARRRLTQVLGSAPADDPGRGRALVAAGRLAHWVGERTEARSLLLEALPIVREQGDHRMTVVALAALSWLEDRLGNDDGMAERSEEAIAAARAASDDWALGLALNGYAACRAIRGDPDRARPMAEEALSIQRRIGDAAGIAVTAGTVAEIAFDAGELELAETALTEALARAREVGFRPAMGYALTDRSVISLLRDDVEAAAADLHAAIETGTPHADSDVASECLSVAATIAAIRGVPTTAATLWAAADTIRAAAREPKAVARLRARWEPYVRAEVGDQATWDAATVAGAELALADAVALAARAAERPPIPGTGVESITR
jgi:predicted ATPase/DNA-binding SARP family transcriptional activator